MARKRRNNLSFDPNSLPVGLQDLQNLRRKLAKRANQRMVRLERASSNITGERFDSFGAIEQVRYYLGEKKRFNERANFSDDSNVLRREIAVLQGFLTSQTSTVKGQRELESKRIKTFESGEWGSSKYTGQKRRALKFASTKEFYDFFNSSTYRKLLESGFTSEQVIEIYDSAREVYDGQDELVMKKMEDALEEFRAKGRATLKDLVNITGAKKIG